ncbi:hypothetical protein QBC41DRAFT_287727 [Cercophora samala]|uniref:Uncharacterized protein n=1 Tax=Cercophora samala TaxID=330535 RepID=A0AA39YVH3_9PEZI|nr:hypothetical protein QBC41DRAFT_287727 [Cercophora samala]
MTRLQYHDFAVPAPWSVALKHHLYAERRKCRHIDIVGEGVCWVSRVDRDSLPVFLVSQLENQKLTEEGSPFVWSTTLVSFVSSHLETRHWVSGYPTLFQWRSEDNRRSYSLFAVLNINMPALKYTVDELMALGGAPVPVPARMSALANNPELADVVRESGSESSTSYKGKHRDDSSTASDELLFKGNISRRALRDATRGSARESTHESSRFPMREPLRQTVPQPALPVQPARQMNQTGAPTVTPMAAPVAPPMAAPMVAPSVAPPAARETVHDQQRPTEWRCHGRSDSETNIAEPISAPTGDIAQRSEGFRRFYKAVVSPTHVRVTAGGRIVPNTRGPPSPTNKRLSDHPAIENMSLTDKSAQGKLPTNQLPMGQPIPIVPQFLPGYPGGFHSLQAPMSVIPMAYSQHMPQAFQFVQAPAAPATLAPLPTGSTSTSKDMPDPKAHDSQSDGRMPSDKQDKPKISPPEWFDYSKPYFYNGQIIYPVGNMPASLANPMGGPMMPMQMVSVPQGAPSQLQAPMMHHALPHGGNQMMAGSSFSQASHGPHQIHGGAHPIIPANSSFTASNLAPPISSIRPSEITRKQIANFKHSLKYHEDQLQYNRHQIDEKEMEMKAQQYREHIASFETLLKQQLEYEAETLDHKTPASSGRNDHAQQKADGSVSGDTGVPQNQHESEDAIRRRVACGRQGVNTNIGEGGNAVFQHSITANQSYGEPSRQTGIPSEAVLAPAFEPCGRSLHEVAVDSNERLKSEGVWKYGPGTQNVASRGVARPFIPSLSHQSDHAEGSTSATSISGQSSSTDGFGTTRSAKGKGVDRAGGSSGYSRSSFGVPYLLGALPKGLDPRKATDHDYTYTRPLNEDETRARYLYWGKAPKSAMRGLPKYDGKHFYPPSPVQEEPSSPVIAHRNPTARSDAEHAYRQTKSDQDPFRPMTPVHDATSKPVVASEDGYVMGRLTRNVSFETQVDSSGLEDVPTGDAIDLPETGTVLRNRENSADAGSIGSIDRRSERSGYGPVPGPFSPHGYLPDPYAHFFQSSQYRNFGRTDTQMQRETLADGFEEGSYDQRDFIDYGAGSSASSLFGARSGFPKPFYQ